MSGFTPPALARYSEWPSAPPAYQDLEDERKGVLPNVHGQCSRGISYGSVPVYPESTVLAASQAQTGPYPRQAYEIYPQHTQPVIIQPTVFSTTVISPAHAMLMLGAEPCSVFCVVCQRRVMTSTSSQYPCAAHLCCFLMFMSGGLCLCSPLAYCVCQPSQVTHTCSNCDSLIGTYYNPDSL